MRIYKDEVGGGCDRDAEDSYGPSLLTMSSIRMLEYASALEAIIGGTRAFESHLQVSEAVLCSQPILETKPRLEQLMNQASVSLLYINIIIITLQGTLEKEK